MEKCIDLNKTVYDLCSKDSQIQSILYELGFRDIIRPGILNTAGRFMTIPKGAAMKKIDLQTIKKSLEEKGYTII